MPHGSAFLLFYSSLALDMSHQVSKNSLWSPPGPADFHFLDTSTVCRRGLWDIQESSYAHERGSCTYTAADQQKIRPNSL